MKKVMRGLMIILAFLMMTVVGITTTKAQGNVSLQVFYDELQPYGTWMDHGHHGYVWIPRVDRGFVPYATNGYWINTEYGNTWASDYAWGWAPFHYGRWLYDDFYGWMWVPDTEWGPAWVAWRSGGGYYGWAPLMPGMGIHTSFHSYDGFLADYWSFVPHRYITYRQVYKHCVPRQQVVKIVNQTTIITYNYTDNRRRTYFTGPTRNDIERRGGGRVTVHQINETDRPARTEVSSSTANFYRPDIDNSRESRSRAMPYSYVRKNANGNFDRVESRGQRTREIPASKMPELNRTSTDNEQRFKSFESVHERRSSEERQMYQPSQRTREFGNEPKRTYQPMPQERQKIARDRYEAPSLERAPSNQEEQRKRYVQRQQWQQPEKPTQRRESGSYNSSSNSRSSMNQSQRSTQVRKGDSNGMNRQPSRSSRLEEFQKKD